jgi:serpin B
MKRLFTLAAMTAILAGFLSCQKVGEIVSPEEPYIPEEGIPDDNGDGNPDENTRKELQLAASSQALLQKTNSFAFHFLSRVNASVKEDYIVSPLSMQFLLGMILNGTQGTTADEICQVLGYGAGEVEAVNEFALSMMEQLPGLDEKTVLDIANAIFVNQSYSIKDTYKTEVVKFYEAEVANKDFQDPATLEAINQWASDHTNGLIPKVLDMIDPDEDLAILMNALYFKGQWTVPFPKENTGKEPFLKENGKKADVDMMKKGTMPLAYRAGNGFRAVSLPYGNEAFSMVVLLPDEGKTVADVIAALGALEWTDFLHSMDHSARVNLWLPKFKTTTKVKLNGILADMGMPQAFTPYADFKALSDNALRLTSVQQDAIIIVDEEGTEAAAVSTGTVGVTSVPPPPVDFHVDRPFLYLITESGTGAILFAGKYGGTELQ